MAKLLELPRLGKYGNWADRHLAEHLPQVRRELQKSGQLLNYLLNVQGDTLSALESVRGQLRKRRPPPKKGSDPLQLVQYESWLKRTSEELVLQEFVLLPDAETARALANGYTD